MTGRIEGKALFQSLLFAGDDDEEKDDIETEEEGEVLEHQQWQQHPPHQHGVESSAQQISTPIPPGSVGQGSIGQELPQNLSTSVSDYDRLSTLTSRIVQDLTMKADIYDMTFPTSCMKYLPSGNFNIGLQTITISKNLIGTEIFLRPDVAREVLLSFLDSVLASLAPPQGVTYRSYDSLSHEKEGYVDFIRLECCSFSNCISTGSAGSSASTDVIRTTVYLTVNAQLQRVIIITTECKNSNQIAFTSMPSLVVSSIHKQIFEIFLLTLQTEKFCICWQSFDPVKQEAKSFYRQFSTCHPTEHDKEKVFSIEEPIEFDQTVPAVVESILCPWYVRDLHLALSCRLQADLTAAASEIDVTIRTTEQRCARMMTLLKPMYTMTSLTLPSSPYCKTLDDYPITDLLHRKRLSQVDLDSCRLLIFNARRHRKKSSSVGAQDSAVEHDVEVGELIDSVLCQLSVAYNDEILKRVQRKIVWGLERVAALEAYRVDMVQTLHSRLVVTKEDREAMRSYKENFRFPDETEPIIFQCISYYFKRKGMMVLTSTHLCFYSSSPLDMIQNVFFSLLASKETAESLLMIIPISTIHKLQVGCTQNEIVILDTGGNMTSMSIDGATGDFGLRVCDTIGAVVLMNQKKGLPSSNSSTTAAAPALPSKSSHDVSARIQAYKSRDVQGASKSAANPVPVSIPIVAPAGPAAAAASAATNDIGRASGAKRGGGLNANAVAAKLAALRAKS